MISESQLKDLRGQLEEMQNPLFLYDNDADGLCSFILLRRFLGRGKGVAVRTYPDIDARYARRAEEFGSDGIVVLDRVFLGKDFIEEIEKMQLKVIWIDHHNMGVDFKHNLVSVFNPLLEKKKSEEPVTYWCYRATKREEDMWIALMGCVSDHYLPDFASVFAEKYPDFWARKDFIKKPFDAYYRTEIGKLARAIGFGLKDSISNVVKMQNFLISCLSPVELGQELESRDSFGNKYREIMKKYESLLREARNAAEKKIVFFRYGGDLSISSELSNELSYLYPGRFIVVVYSKGNVSNISLRGAHARDIFEKVIVNFEGASGGGHEEAVGARMQTKDLDNFKAAIEKEL